MPLTERQLTAFADQHAGRIPYDTSPATSPAQETPGTSPTAWLPPDGAPYLTR